MMLGLFRVGAQNVGVNHRKSLRSAPTAAPKWRRKMMTRGEAIDALDNLLGMIEDNHGTDYDEAIKMAIDALKQLERKTGKWVFSPDHAEGICTVCQYKIYGRSYNNTYLIVPYNYCPNCGAGMKGGDDADNNQI